MLTINNMFNINHVNINNIHVNKMYNTKKNSVSVCLNYQMLLFCLPSQRM